MNSDDRGGDVPTRPTAFLRGSGEVKPPSDAQVEQIKALTAEAEKLTMDATAPQDFGNAFIAVTRAARYTLPVGSRV